MLDEASETLILVNEDDVALSTSGKLEAHRSGELHRAFSVFVFRSDGTVLLQRRADTKYHSGGQWANTCCGHPRPGEDIIVAGERRLEEELGFHCELGAGFKARYRAELDNGMIENELVHVLFGRSDAVPVPNPDEASATRCMTLDELGEDIQRNPQDYAVWLVTYFAAHARQIAEARDSLFSVLPQLRETD